MPLTYHAAIHLKKKGIILTENPLNGCSHFLTNISVSISYRNPSYSESQEPTYYNVPACIELQPVYSNGEDKGCPVSGLAEITGYILEQGQEDGKALRTIILPEGKLAKGGAHR